MEDVKGWRRFFQKFPLAKRRKTLYNKKPTTEYAGVMELVDVLDSKSSAARRAGSSPATGTRTNESRFSNNFIEKRDSFYRCYFSIKSLF